MKRAIILVLDSFGIGAADDAESFGDVGADTLGHIAAHCAQAAAAGTRARRLTLPNLTRLGLMHAARESTGRYPEGCAADVEVTGATTAAVDFSGGGDSTLLGSDIHDNPGAAVIVRDGASPRIAHNSFARNAGSERASGALVVEAGAAPRFFRNVFVALSPDSFVTITGAASSVITARL